LVVLVVLVASVASVVLVVLVVLVASVGLRRWPLAARLASLQAVDRCLAEPPLVFQVQVRARLPPTARRALPPAREQQPARRRLAWTSLHVR
jgi:hypothetical protein